MAKFYCEYCGYGVSTVQALTSGHCIRHPAGANKGTHKLYEGGEKARYTCKYCGYSVTTLHALVNSHCVRHPNGMGKGCHAPVL